jgi:hypothetical protein
MLHPDACTCKHGLYQSAFVNASVLLRELSEFSLRETTKLVPATVSIEIMALAYAI